MPPYLCIPIQPSATRYASALGQSLRPWKMPRNWPIRQEPELNYKAFNSLGCILVKALDWDAQQQRPKPTTNNLNQQPEVQQHIISPKNPRADDPLPLFCNRRVKIPLDIVLMACACCPTQRIRLSRLVKWTNHMDGRDGGRLVVVNCIFPKLLQINLPLMCFYGSIPLWRRVRFLYLYKSQEWRVNLSYPCNYACSISVVIWGTKDSTLIHLDFGSTKMASWKRDHLKM